MSKLDRAVELAAYEMHDEFCCPAAKAKWRKRIGESCEEYGCLRKNGICGPVAHQGGNTLGVYFAKIHQAVQARREAGEEALLKHILIDDPADLEGDALREAAQRVVDVNNSEYGPPPTPLSTAIENLWAVLETNREGS